MLTSFLFANTRISLSEPATLIPLQAVTRCLRKGAEVLDPAPATFGNGRGPVAPSANEDGAGGGEGA